MLYISSLTYNTIFSRSSSDSVYAPQSVCEIFDFFDITRTASKGTVKLDNVGSGIFSHAMAVASINQPLLALYNYFLTLEPRFFSSFQANNVFRCIMVVSDIGFMDCDNVETVRNVHSSSSRKFLRHCGYGSFFRGQPGGTCFIDYLLSIPMDCVHGLFTLRLCCSNNTLARLYVLRVTAGLTLFVLYQTSRPFSGVGGWDQRSSTPPHTDRLSPTWKPGKLAPSPYRNTNSSHVAECTNL